MPIQAPVRTTRLFLSNLTGIFLFSNRFAICVIMKASTTKAVVFANKLKILETSIILYNIINIILMNINCFSRLRDLSLSLLFQFSCLFDRVKVHFIIVLFSFVAKVKLFIFSSFYLFLL